MSDDTEPIDFRAVGSGPFGQLLYALVMDPGATIEGLHPDMAVLRLGSGGPAVLLVRWRLETADGLAPTLKPILSRLAAATEVEVALVGGPREARKVLSRATPFFSTRRIYLYHVPETGKAWCNVLRAPGWSRVWPRIKGSEPGSLPAPDWERFGTKLGADLQAREAEQSVVREFLSRGHRPLATYVLLAVLAGFFLLEIALGGSGDGLVLIRLGGLVPELVRAGQWWRLLSCTVLHAGFVHLAFNAYVLLALGSSLERVLGTQRFLILYWASAIAGSAASLLLGRHELSVGASGALWGLLAAEAALALRPRGLLPEGLAAAGRRTAVVNLAINVVNSFRPRVDMAAHFGGGAVGALLLLSGAVTAGLPRLGEPEPALPRPQSPSWRDPAAAAAVVLAGVALAIALWHARPWVAKPTRGESAFLLEDQCTAGDFGACNNLGLLRSGGEGVAADPALAMTLFVRACDGGDMNGCLNAASRYATGEGAAKSVARAVSLYERACNGSEPIGCLELGVLRYRGDGVSKDLARAASLFERACKGGNAAGCLDAGIVHENGEGVDKSAERAVAHYVQACDRGQATGCFKLGVFHHAGTSVPKDDARAASLFQKACDGGENAGCYTLATMYHHGAGAAKDLARAAALYRRACEGGLTGACEAAKTVPATR